MDLRPGTTVVMLKECEAKSTGFDSSTVSPGGGLE